MSEGLRDAIREAVDRWQAMSPEQQADMKRRQRESYIRGMTTPCEHGALDFEACPDCRGLASHPDNRVG